MPRLRPARWLMVAAIWLLIGAVLTVLVAWTIAFLTTRSGLRHPSEVEIHQQSDPWPFERIDGSLPISWATFHHSLWKWDTAAFAHPPDRLSISLESYGSPFLSLQHVSTLSVLEEPEMSFGGRWTVSANTAPGFHPPLRPLWPGFALNTFLYAALAWSLWQLPLALRRRLRRKHNHCSRCNYDLAGLALVSPCPECGKPRFLK